MITVGTKDQAMIFAARGRHTGVFAMDASPILSFLLDHCLGRNETAETENTTTYNGFWFDWFCQLLCQGVRIFPVRGQQIAKGFRQS
jgi:hypothetical protein